MAPIVTVRLLLQLNRLENHILHSASSTAAVISSICTGDIEGLHHVYKKPLYPALPLQLQRDKTRRYCNGHIMLELHSCEYKICSEYILDSRSYGVGLMNQTVVSMNVNEHGASLWRKGNLGRRGTGMIPHKPRCSSPTCRQVNQDCHFGDAAI